MMEIDSVVFESTYILREVGATSVSIEEVVAEEGPFEFAKEEQDLD